MIPMKKPQGPMLQLLLRVAAVAVTGTAAFLALRRFNRDQAVAALRRDIRDALLLLDGQPPVILVAGFRAYGKSSFVNTASRALAAETGPVILRTETAPPGPGAATLQCRIIRAAVARATGEEEEQEADGDDDEDAVVEMVDSPALPEPGRLTRAEAEAALFGNPGAPPPECVVVVARCGGSRKERHVAVKKLADVAALVRERGSSNKIPGKHLNKYTKHLQFQFGPKTSGFSNCAPQVICFYLVLKLCPFKSYSLISLF